jgi:hypothetical protein
MSDDKDQFERWIDEGVRRYVAAEPPLGMEARVLAELGQQQQRRGLWRPWMIAVPVAALLALVIGLSLQEKTRPQPVAPQVSKAGPVSPAQPAPKPEVAVRVPQRHAHPVVQAAARAPRPQTFPAAAPPSQQEMLLARLAGDRAAAQTVAASTARTSENIVISRVTIDPIEIPLLPGPNPGE